MRDTEEKLMSWGWIIFLLVIFWPAGLYFLLKRHHHSKGATITDGRTLLTVSYVLMGFGVFYLYMSITEESGMLLAVVLFGGGGILLNRIAKKTKTTGDQYKKYITLIINQNQTSIEKIAFTVGQSYETVASDLQYMIDMRYFANAYIDHIQGEIVLAKATPPQDITASSTQSHERIVTCGGCGANNRLYKKTGECEYCGSLLQ